MAHFSGNIWELIVAYERFFWLIYPEIAIQYKKTLNLAPIAIWGVMKTKNFAGCMQPARNISLEDASSFRQTRWF